MCFMGSVAVDTNWRTVCTETATRLTGCCGTGVVPRRVVFAAPAACSGFGAFECVVAVTLTVAALRLGAKTQATFKTEGSREGREARKECKVLCLGAGGSDNNSGRFFADALFLRSEPSGRV